MLASHLIGAAGADHFGFVIDSQGEFARLACGTYWVDPITLAPMFGPPAEGALIIKQGDDLANWYSTEDWPRISNGLQTDAIVSTVSAFGDAPIEACWVTDAVHGPGTVYHPRYLWSTDHLGLNPPQIMEAQSGSIGRILALLSAVDTTDYYDFYQE